MLTARCVGQRTSVSALRQLTHASILLHVSALLLAHVQVAALTRLHSLDLDCCSFKSNQYAPLAALSGMLQSLTINKCHSLPDCLPTMLALRTLVSTPGAK